MKDPFFLKSVPVLLMLIVLGMMLKTDFIAAATEKPAALQLDTNVTEVQIPSMPEIHPEASINVPAVQKKNPIDPSVVSERLFVDTATGKKTLEVFHHNLRAEKKVMDGKGRLLERWVFDPTQNERITGYEVYNYQQDALIHSRTASWKYDASGDFLKTNHNYDGEGKPTGYFLEYTGVNGIKFAEEWYDTRDELISQKLWHPETGAFLKHIYIKRISNDLRRIQWMNEKGVKKSEAVFSLSGGKVPFSAVQFGKSYETDPFRNMAIRDGAKRKPSVL